MKRMFKWLGSKNGFLKPVSVITNVAAPLSYVLYQTQAFVVEEIDSELVAISNNLLTGIRGAIILLFVLLSIIQIYKPPKIVTVSLVLGGVMVFASSLFSTLGIALLLFGLSNVFNSYTFERLILRNDKIKKAKEDQKIDMLIGGKHNG